MHRNTKKAQSINLGINENGKVSNLSNGDSEKCYAGASSPSRINTPMEEGVIDNDTPEAIMESKERWQAVRSIICGNLKTRPYFEMLMDHFSGHTYEELAERHKTTRQLAHYHVTFCLDYLKERLAREDV